MKFSPKYYHFSHWTCTWSNLQNGTTKWAKASVCTKRRHPANRDRYTYTHPLSTHTQSSTLKKLYTAALPPPLTSHSFVHPSSIFLPLRISLLLVLTTNSSFANSTSKEQSTVEKLHIKYGHPEFPSGGAHVTLTGLGKNWRQKLAWMVDFSTPNKGEPPNAKVRYRRRHNN